VFAEISTDCPVNYISLPPLCFKAVTERVENITNAADICTVDGSTLPVIRSLEFQNKLFLLLRIKQQLDAFWLGLSYSSESANLARWTTGEIFNPVEYNNFSDSRRIDDERRCAIFNRGFSEWQNHFCQNMRHAVCMKWSQSVKPVIIISNELRHIATAYFPQNGIIRSGSPVYKSLDQTLYLYRTHEETGTVFTSSF